MRVRPALVSGVLVAAVLVTAATTALAHSALRSSDPPDGARLDDAPTEVVLVYTEEPDADLSRVSLFDATGAPVVENGELVPEPGNVETITMAVPDLDDGLYTVSWQALSAVDGHVTTGAFSFAVGDVDPDDADTVAPPSTATRTEPSGRSPRPAAVTGRWLIYAGLALLLGWALSYLVVFRSAPTRRRWVLVACWAVAVAGLALLAVSEAASVEVGVSRLLQSTTGERLVRIAVALAVCAAAVGFATFRPSAVSATVLAVVVAGSMYTYTMAGHAGAPSDLRWMNLGLQWLHVVAIGVWIGGLVWLLAGLAARRTEPAVAPALRFSALATVSLLLVVLTGVVRAWVEVGSWSELWSSDYGVTFLIKIGLVIPLVALGALNRFRQVPALRGGERARRPLARTVGGELLFAAAVFGATGVLAGVPPPIDHEAMEGMEAMVMNGDADEEAVDDVSSVLSVVGSDFGTSVRVTMDVEPGMVGNNRFSVRVADYDSDDPLDADSVVLSFTVPERAELGPTVLELEPTADGGWEAEGTVLAFPGAWRATTVIVASPDGYEIPLDFEVGTTPPVAPDTTDMGGMDDMDDDTDDMDGMSDG